MSTIDILSSLNAVVGFSMLPRGYFWGAAGNTLTCNISGFLFELGTAVGMYNLGLSSYYYLSLRAKKKQRFISMYVEPFIHVICLVVPLAFAVWAWVAEALNPLRGVGGWCYIYKFPPRCDEFENLECTRGSAWFLIGSISMLGKGVPVWLGIIITMTLLWYYVKAQEVAIERYRFRSEANRTRQAFQQAMLYIFAYFFTYIFSLINLFLPSDAVQLNFCIAVLVKLTLPLQGFFNFLIYIRPRLLTMRERSENGDKSLLELVRIIITRGKGNNVLAPRQRRQRDSFIFPAFQTSRSSLRLSERASRLSRTSSTKCMTVQEEAEVFSRAKVEVESCESNDVDEDFDEYAHKLVELLQRNAHITMEDSSGIQQETDCTNLDEEEQKESQNILLCDLLPSPA